MTDTILMVVRILVLIAALTLATNGYAILAGLVALVWIGLICHQYFPILGANNE